MYFVCECVYTHIHTQILEDVAHLQSLYVVKDDSELLFLLLLPPKYQYYRYTPGQSFHTKHQL